MNTHMIPCPCPFVKRGYAEISSIFLENRRAKGVDKELLQVYDIINHTNVGVECHE